MPRPIATTLSCVVLSLGALTGGCTANPSGAARPLKLTPEMAADTPAFACPWIDAEHYRIPAKLPGAAAAPLAPFVPGCAIIRFRVAADGSVFSPALRAANPLNDGPTALAALRQMRFAPARKADTQFVIRLEMRRDNSGGVSVTTETRGGAVLFGEES